MVAAPALTIGIPVFNGARFVAETIEASLAQTDVALHVVVADNASTDDTPAICRDYARADPRLRYVRFEEHLGVAGSYSRTFGLCETEFFKWAASDDLFHPTFAHKALAALRAQGPVSTLLTQAAQEYREHRSANALTLYRQALPLLGNEPAAAPAILALGVDALHRKSYDEAYLLFDRLPLADPKMSTRARLWQRLTLEFKGDLVGAEPLFQQSITQANAPTNDLITALDLYVRFLTRLPDRTPDVNRYNAQAAAVRQSTRRSPPSTS